MPLPVAGTLKTSREPWICLVASSATLDGVLQSQRDKPHPYPEVINRHRLSIATPAPSRAVHAVAGLFVSGHNNYTFTKDQARIKPALFGHQSLNHTND